MAKIDNEHAGGMTLRDHVARRIRKLTMEEMKDPTNFSEGDFTVLWTAMAEQFDVNRLAHLVNCITGKWPHARRVDVLAELVSRLIHRRHIKKVEGGDLSEVMKKRLRAAADGADLRKKRPDWATEQLNRETLAKPKREKVRDAVHFDVMEAAKEMNFIDLGLWAAKVGVSKERIKKYRVMHGKNPGMARMQLTNGIKTALRKQTKAEPAK